MKTSLLFLLLASCSSALADIAIYNGVKVTKTTAPEGSSTVVEKFIQAVDLDTSQVTVVTLGTSAKGPKKRTFIVEPEATVLLTSVKDGRSKRTLTVLTQAGTILEPVTGLTSVSSMVQSGGNLSVSIRTGTKTDLPRNMQGNGTLVEAETDTEVGTAFVTTKYTLVLQDKFSRGINDADETLEEAVERVAADLILKGYWDITPVPPVVDP